MRNKSYKITITAVMTAMTVTLMYLSSIMPTGRLGFLGLSSLMGVAAVIESGLSGGIMVYIGGCLLGFLLAPAKDIVLVYAVFFGYYPILKSAAERVKSVIMRWIIKLGVMNIALTVLAFGFDEIFFDVSGLDYALPIVYAAVNAVFILYDIGVTGVIGFYITKVRRKIKRH